MTTLHSQREQQRHFKLMEDKQDDRRTHRRYELGGQTLMVNRWDQKRRQVPVLGYLMDLSAGGCRVRTNQPNITADNQIRVRLELPNYAGICPFVDTSSTQPKPKNEWIGWMAVSRVIDAGNGQYDVAGRLVDMDDMDRGMLGLYLSTQPLAA